MELRPRRRRLSRPAPPGDRPSAPGSGGGEAWLRSQPLVVRAALSAYRATVWRAVNRLFLVHLMVATQNFDDVTWLGRPVWQNVLDLWTLQEEICRLRPATVIETGTNRGGSALFFASVMDLLDHGHVFTADVERLHGHSHPRVTFHIGSSTADETVAAAQAAVDEHGGPVVVILDSDHSAAHVARELELYAPMVTPGSLLLVQDGVIDRLWGGRPARPGPLPAVREFLARHPEFAADTVLERRFVITQHPLGWLRRLPDPGRA